MNTKFDTIDVIETAPHTWIEWRITIFLFWASTSFLISAQSDQHNIAIEENFIVEALKLIMKIIKRILDGHFANVTLKYGFFKHLSATRQIKEMYLERYSLKLCYLDMLPKKSQYSRWQRLVHFQGCAHSAACVKYQNIFWTLYLSGESSVQLSVIQAFSRFNSNFKWVFLHLLLWATRCQDDWQNAFDSDDGWLHKYVERICGRISVW